jgi:3-oxoacyl-[acyl-carrier-protein] synthase-3
MPGAQIIDVVNFMPERVVDNATLVAGDEQQNELSKDAFFDGVKSRRFASPEYESSDLGSLALKALMERTGTGPEKIDLILYSCIFNDHFWPAIGPAIQHRCGAVRATVINVDTGCSSYLSMLNTARAFIESGIYKTVAVVTVTNFISRLPEFQKSKKSWVLGDGASATLLAAGESSIVSFHERSHGEHYGLFVFQPDAVDGRHPDMVMAIRRNALDLVPEAVLQCLAGAGLSVDDVSLLITHQPNTAFIREWRERIGIGAPRVHDTLAYYGNLFQGSIPVTLADAIDKGKVQPGNILALGTFSNGGDFVSAMTLKWR